MKRSLCLCAAIVALLCASQVRADDPPKFDPKTIQPGEFHQKLEPLVGDFEFTMKFWMEPGKPAIESKGTSSTKWILGKRYLQQFVTGDFGGEKFEGMGLTGYDNLEKKYVFSWVDNMGTGIMQGAGSVDKSGKVFTYHSELMDPMTGQRVKEKDVTTLVDANTFKSEFYRINGDKEVKMMEITYTRKK
jgi:hypothetical protein